MLLERFLRPQPVVYEKEFEVGDLDIAKDIPEIANTIKNVTFLLYGIC